MGGPGQGAGGDAQFADIENQIKDERVRGKLDPKGRITVTTFRGLPRPGQVTTEFREELARAREDAQAPLSTEQIPRRYRDRIRDYFDRLQKEE